MIPIRFPLHVVAMLALVIAQSGAASLSDSTAEVGVHGASVTEVAGALEPESEPAPDFAVLLGAVGIMRILRRRR
jgi:hypothetical protein